jgi:hypothetical protein
MRRGTKGAMLEVVVRSSAKREKRVTENAEKPPLLQSLALPSWVLTTVARVLFPALVIFFAPRQKP